MPSPEPTTETAIMLSPQLLAEARSDTARKWTVRAPCVGADPELFFRPATVQPPKPGTSARCCPIGGQCLAYAVAAAEPFGIWGGLDPRERQRLRRQLQRQEAPASPQTGSAA